MDRQSATAPPLAAIALLSGVALGYEVLLTRLFAILQWHHFAHMIISLALLGLGASGSFLTLLGGRLRRRFATAFVANGLLFGAAAIVCFLLAQRVPFNPLELAWDWRQLPYLLLIYLLLAIPFFAVANCIGLALWCWRGREHRVYAADLLGAGAGALGVVALLYALPPGQALPGVAALGLLAAAVGAWEVRLGFRWVALGVVMAVGALALPASWTALQPSPYKGLSQARRVQGAEVLTERSSPLGELTALRNRLIPPRFAPGLSLAATAGPPDQIGLYIDGEAAGAITRFRGDPSELGYLDQLTSALPYHLARVERVAVLGAGGGTDVLQALAAGATRIDAVEINPQLIDLVRSDFGDFAGALYRRPEVHVQVAEARGFVTGSAARYDLIQVALLDAYGSAAAGLYALSESYLYTTEALRSYLDHLRPGGWLALTRWLRLPPRDSLKLFATALAALESAGIADPAQRLALIRGWKTTTLVVKNGPLTAGDGAALRRFCRERSFDPVYYPGITAAEVNRYNRLQQPFLHQGALALAGPERARFLADYPFDLTPATDDRPYFFHFFRWRTLPGLLAMQARSGLAQLEWGYLVLVATLVQALLASVLLVLAPLWCLRRRPGGAAPRGSGRPRVLTYFAAIGLGFMFVEMAFIQRFVLLLSHPVHAVAAVLSAFLLFAGLGSAGAAALQSALATRWPRVPPLYWIAGMISGLALAYLWLLPGLFHHLSSLPMWTRVASAVVLIAPLAWAMGMPFPLGMARVGAATPDLVPWAWAVNGCASVVSAVLAPLLAMELGFGGVVVGAAALYGLAAWVLPGAPVLEARGARDHPRPG